MSEADIPEPVIIPNPAVPKEPQAVGGTEPFYYILKAGTIMGPLSIRAIAQLAHSHQLDRGDFLQIAGNSHWLPLATALDPSVPPPAGTPPAPAPMTILRWGWMRLRYNLGEKSLPAGLVCLAMACLGVLLTQWPPAFWGPLVLLPIAAACALLHRRRFVAGLLLLAAVGLLLFFTQR